MATAALVTTALTPQTLPLTNPDKTLDVDGRNDSASPAWLPSAPSAANMSAGWNPDARVFTPAGYSNDPREQFFNGHNGQAPAHHVPFPPPGRPPFDMPPNMHPNFPPPPPPPFFQHPNQYPQQHPNQHPDPRSNQQAFFAAQAEEHARAYQHQWAQQHGHPHPQWQRQGPPHPPHGFPPPPPFFDRPPGFGSGLPPFGFPPHGLAPHGPPPKFQQRGYSDMATQPHMNMAHGGNGEDMQAAAPPSKKNKQKGQKKQKETSPGPKEVPSTKKGRYGENKIMMPAPPPTDAYLAQAAEPPETAERPIDILVILDLNGTVLFRPNRNAKTMIERPFLKPFLRYLFQHFKVMVWSSAKPDNVKSLVGQALDNTLRSQLVAQWARESFGLSPTNYNQNVQVYKNLRLVWSRDVIHQHHPQYAAGARFGQHNTVLIDDSALKANAQPFNLLQIPEFAATPEQMESDDLREVAGYLEVLRQQADVSKFINKQPFVGDGRWSYDWPDEIAGGGEMITKASAKKSKKKNKKQNGAELATDRSATPQVKSDTERSTPGPTDAAATSVVEATESMASVSLTSAVSKDW